MLKVLIVDDSLIIRKKISYIFENLGQHNILTATNGKEAIDSYKKYKPDLVTMDITMPDMDGITAVQHIIKEDKDAKIIMVTSCDQEDIVIKSIQSGAVNYMLKPITEEKILQVIGEFY